MFKIPSYKLVFLFSAGLIVCLLIIFSYPFYQSYRDIFRLSYKQVSQSLTNITPECTQLIYCKLLPGDILIRRYITPRTRPVDRFLKLYLTHAAFYWGDGYLVEAIGTEDNPVDDIQIRTLSDSDWLNPDMENFILIRPKNYSEENLKISKTDLKAIAEDPDYIFGFPKQDEKKATCADLIFTQLTKHALLQTSNVPKKITPDYLYWTTQKDKNNFEIVGYNLTKH